ncbi:complement C3-like [Danio aesculapii]|uniref:complement C3-like n=1 Tax=Danio aesculapii TaxID=1142201 RepID=UPI0024C03E4D|nr:complement C3-like [Danio aesculapii]
MGQLIVQPQGNGEQNMIFMTLPVIATHYLDSTNQWDAIGMKRRDEAIYHIKTGYDQQQAYRKPDGSYAALIGQTEQCMREPAFNCVPCEPGRVQHEYGLLCALN